MGPTGYRYTTNSKGQRIRVWTFDEEKPVTESPTVRLLKARLAEAREESAGRLRALKEKAEEARREWQRAEEAEAKVVRHEAEIVSLVRGRDRWKKSAKDLHERLHAAQTFHMEHPRKG